MKKDLENHTMNSTVKPIAANSHPEDRPPRRVYDNVAQLVGDPDNPTPMVRLSERFDPDGRFDLFIKLERNNPFGSIKDRTALYLLNGTPLREGQVLTEPTAGNTGIALAALANARGMPIELALPDGTPEEKKALLRFLGAGLLEVEDELCPLFPTEGARGVVKSLVESEAFNGRYVSPNQYENALNVEAHYRTTGPEIWRDTQGSVTHFVSAMGTTGTIMGTSRYLKEVNPAIEIVGVTPTEGSSIPGIRRWPEEYLPSIYEASRVDRTIEVSQEDAERTTLELAAREGIFAGVSSGGAVAAALSLSAQLEHAVIVAIICDRGDRYLSTGVFPAE